MSRSQEKRASQTKPLVPSAPATLATLHIIPHLQWEREGYETFEVRRARLLNTLTRLHQQMQNDPQTHKPAIRYFLLGGQTVILEDVAAVRPDLISLFVIFNAGGRLGVGPWYVSVDEALVSGEALIRNLLLARVDAEQRGLKLMPVAYAPEASGHTAQLPQILRGFGIDAAFLQHGAPVDHLPFRWEAPDGSNVLVINHEARVSWPILPENATDVAESSLEQRAVRPDGPFLWLYDAENSSQLLSEILPEVREKTTLPIKQSDLPEYVGFLRQELPDALRPALEGELRLQFLHKNVYLLPGTLSSRMYLKQANARLQATLSHWIEPWLAVALTHGKVPHPKNLHGLLNYGWRLLLKNQSRNALGGNASDAAHAEHEIRYQQIEDITGQMVVDILEALPGTPHQANAFISEDQTYLVVWNSLNWPVKQIVEIKPDLPPDKYLLHLFDTQDVEQIFDCSPDGTMHFLAEVPAVGYAVYTLVLGNTPPSDKHYVQVSPGSVIRKANGDTLSIKDGALVWQSNEAKMVINDLLQFYDGGDAGDTYNYSPPGSDVLVQADLVENDAQIESSPLYERLIIKHRMRVATGLRQDRTRDRGVKLIELTTTATFYDHIPGVYFHTTFDNTAKDHRLRVHLGTNLDSDTVLADTAFAVIERPVAVNGPPLPESDQRNVEGVSNTQPVQNAVSVTDGKKALTMMVRGLPEYEALEENNQITLALTLVRSVGWLSRDDLQSRTAAVAPMLPVPGAQCQREITAEYGLVATPAEDRAAIARAGLEFNVPLRTYQYDECPDRLWRSYLSVVSDRAIGHQSDGDGVILSAFKPLTNARGWLLRLFNPHDRVVETFITPHERPDKTYRLTLAEKPMYFVQSDANGRITVRFNPFEIVTLRILFA